MIGTIHFKLKINLDGVQTDLLQVKDEDMHKQLNSPPNTTFASWKL